MQQPIPLDGLYEVSKRLLVALPTVFLKAEPHEGGDPDGSDLLWFRIEANNPLQAGEVIAVAPGHPGTWYVSHDTMNNFGGNPTHWDEAVAELRVIEVVNNYLSKR